jgi:endonuclease-3
LRVRADEFGSEALPERHVAPAVFRYQVLIALMLSSQTRDQVVGAAMRKLQAHGLTIENILATDDEELRAMLFGVGFYNNKTCATRRSVQRSFC